MKLERISSQALPKVQGIKIIPDNTLEELKSVLGDSNSKRSPLLGNARRKTAIFVLPRNEIFEEPSTKGLLVQLRTCLEDILRELSKSLSELKRNKTFLEVTTYQEKLDNEWTLSPNSTSKQLLKWKRRIKNRLSEIQALEQEVGTQKRVHAGSSATTSKLHSIRYGVQGQMKTRRDSSNLETLELQRKIEDDIQSCKKLISRAKDEMRQDDEQILLKTINDESKSRTSSETTDNSSDAIFGSDQSSSES